MESDDDKLWCLPFASRECEQVRMRPSGYFVLCISLELKILILQVGSPLRATGRQEESKLDILSLSLYRNTLDPTPNFDRRKTIYESDTSQVTRVINYGQLSTYRSSQPQQLSTCDGRRHCLSGNPRVNPNGGKTKRRTAFFATRSSEYLAMVATSDSSSWIKLRFSSIRDGVTDLGRTEDPRATDTENKS